MNRITERFLRYVKIGTTADENSETFPSTATQLEFGRMLAEEMREIGLEHVEIDEHGYIFGTLPANVSGVPVLGLVAHMDTAPSAPGDPVRPQVVAYQGGDIVLNQVHHIVLSPNEYPELNRWVGSNVIVTDGMTLLGADDKAGIAEILEAVEYLKEHDELLHGEVRIAFTPDEEIGNGTKYFDVTAFGAEKAYTVDGGRLGEIEYENFNAAKATVEIRGLGIHTGVAKGKMKNALLIAHQFQSMLPQAEIPACTEGREGFYHLRKVEGGVEHASMIYNIREHDRELFEQRKERMKKITAYLNDIYGEGTVTLRLEDGKRNMLEIISQHPEMIEKAKQAFLDCGVQPMTPVIRGGTDGAELSFRGVPCPNLSTGGENFHSRYEWIAEPALLTMADVLVKLVCSFAKEDV